MFIDEHQDFSVGLADELRRLCYQLSTTVPDNDQIRKILASDASHLLLAKEGDVVLGMLTLVIFPIPTGIRGWIEDVVVDTDVRGKGVGKALVLHALELAGQLDAKTVDLTSRPSREAANLLYQKVGFVLRETNIYRYKFKYT